MIAFIRELVIALFNNSEKILLAAVAVAQVVLLWRQERLMRRQYVATFRPKLIIRSMRLKADEDQSGTIGVLQIWLSNTGASTARIDSGFVKVDLFGRDDPLPPPHGIVLVWGSNQLPDLPKPLAGGETEMLEHRLKDQILTPNALAEYRRSDLVVVGRLAFSDDNGVTRYLGFCRRYDAAKQRFEVMDEPDYEYAD